MPMRGAHSRCPSTLANTQAVDSPHTAAINQGSQRGPGDARRSSTAPTNGDSSTSSVTLRPAVSGSKLRPEASDTATR